MVMALRTLFAGYQNLVSDDGRQLSKGTNKCLCMYFQQATALAVRNSRLYFQNCTGMSNYF